MTTLTKLLLVLASLSAGPVLAQPEITYKGTAIGSSSSLFNSKHSGFTCVLHSKSLNVCSNDSISYGGIKASRTTATFINDQLSQVDILIAKTEKPDSLISYFSVLNHAISEDFGRVQEQSDRLGTMARRLFIWRRSTNELMLSLASTDKVELLGVLITSSDHDRRALEARRKDAKKDI